MVDSAAVRPVRHLEHEGRCAVTRKQRRVDDSVDATQQASVDDDVALCAPAARGSAARAGDAGWWAVVGAHPILQGVVVSATVCSGSLTLSA